MDLSLLLIDVCLSSASKGSLSTGARGTLIAPCPNSPAAAIWKPPTSAGTSFTVMCAWARSRFACGFYPGSHPSECTDGTAATFDEARADFEVAWQVFLSNRTEADFQAWRDERDWTARKYAMWERGERMPSQKPGSLMTCPCGEVFNSHRLEETQVHVPHISAAQA